MDRKGALNRVRRQVLLVRQLMDRQRELAADGVHSPRMNGMPKAMGGIAAGLEARVSRREEMERLIRRESEVLIACEKEAREAMDGLKPELYAFCVMYYINGFTLDETAQALERCERQCTRYRREIEREAG